MKTCAVLPALLAVSLRLWAGDCQCAIPIKPKECVPVCRGALLMKLNKSDLMDKLKLDDKTATELIETRENGAKSFTDLEKLLPKKDQIEIQTKFNKLDSDTGNELFKKYEVKEIKEPTYRPGVMVMKK
jgi:hypothetical protein